MAAHENELQLMAEKMDADRQRQMLTLRDRMSERRRRRMEDLRRKQELEVTKETLTQKKELDEVRTVKVSYSTLVKVSKVFLNDRYGDMDRYGHERVIF